MDTSEAGYSFIRQLDAGAAAQDALRVGFESRDGDRGGIRGVSQLHAAAQRSPGPGLCHSHAHMPLAERHNDTRGFVGGHVDRHTGSDMCTSNDQQQLRYHAVVPNDQHEPRVAAAPGWAGNSPSQEEKKKKRKKKQTTANDSCEQQGNEHPSVPCSQQPATGWAAHSQAAGTKKKKKKKGQQDPQRQPSNKNSDVYFQERPSPAKQASKFNSFRQQRSQARVGWKEQFPPKKPAGQPGPSSAAVPAFKNPFLSKMKGRKSAATVGGPAPQQSPELHGLSSDKASEGAIFLALILLREPWGNGRNICQACVIISLIMCLCIPSACIRQ